MTARATTALAILALGVWVACSGPVPIERPRISDGRYVMGTVLEVTLRGIDPERGREALGEAFEVEDLGAHPVKGKAEPLPVFRVTTQHHLDARENMS